MERTLWNDGWKFWKDRDSFALVWNVPETAVDVTLPHDAMLLENTTANSQNGTNTGFRDAECYTYVKRFFAPRDWEEKNIAVVFEGIYMNALVYLNGQFVAKSPSGYATFTANLSTLLRYNAENELRVQVKAGAMPNSRWYSGAGIYRDVYLLQGAHVHIAENGIKITTEESGETAVIKAEITIENKSAKAYNLTLNTLIKNADMSVAAEKSTFFLPAGKSRILVQRLVIEHATLWSDETPNLYTACVSLAADDACFDSTAETFGIRTLSLDAKRGLRVNGTRVKLRGACIHHDNGLLGAATYEEAEWRRVSILKEAGFNAIRMSHQPMSPAMLRACDALGMYVMDEYSDMWTRTKSSYDYALYFEEWWRTDVASMVAKDFNHPSVILYSIGNEIPEIGTDGGSQYAHEISALFHTLDPSRYTTAGINGVFMAGDAIGKIIGEVMQTLSAKGKGTDNESGGSVNDFMTVMDKHMDKIVVHDEISQRLEKACAPLDVAGYNYMRARYASDGKSYPNRIIVGSETYPPDIAKNWRDVLRLNHVIGDFTWTGWDYIGEAGVGIPAYAPGEGGFGARFPAQLAYCGDIDITGFRRPMSYLREIVFGLRTKPYIAVQNPHHYGKSLIKTPWVLSDAEHSWNYSDCIGKPCIVEVYAAGDEVELFVNGVSQGRKAAGEQVDFRTCFEVTIQEGTLQAVSYKNGKIVGRDEITTAGSPSKILLEKEHISTLVFVTVSIVDSAGILVTKSDTELAVSCTGNIQLLGFGSGNPKPDRNYTEHTARIWNGRALAIFKTKDATDAHISFRTNEAIADTQLSASLHILPHSVHKHARCGVPRNNEKLPERKGTPARP